MAGNQRQHNQNAPVVTPTDVLRARVDGHWILDDQRWEAHVREHDKAEASVDKRLLSMNEFRAQLTTQASTFLTKDVFEAWRDESARRHEELRNSITDLQQVNTKEQGQKIGQGVVIAAIIGTVAFIATLAGLMVLVANLLASHTTTVASAAHYILPR